MNNTIICSFCFLRNINSYKKIKNALSISFILNYYKSIYYIFLKYYITFFICRFYKRNVKLIAVDRKT